MTDSLEQNSDLGVARIARGKVRSIEEIAEITARLRSQGETVVLAHGVFDLLHLGHVRHLEEARRAGSVLVVTITADQFVNKGPGRPIFSDMLRAEMLAALEYVDWVGINHSASAEIVLRTIKPSIYVKGSEYENPDEDITGKIVSERRAVEENGGSILFTHDITFSSSALINRHLDVYDPALRNHLDVVRADNGLNAVIELIERIKDYRILMVGETIIDDYQYVSPLGKSSKENMIATLFQSRELFAGGVIAAANHVAGFCKEVEVITCLGAAESYEDLVRESLHDNVRLTPVLLDGVPTTRKSRFLDYGYLRKLFEVYVMDDTPLPSEIAARLDRLIVEKAKDFDLVIVTDFGHGMIGSSTIDTLIKHSRFLAVNAQSNSANRGFNLVTRYKKADYISIDAPEAQLATANKHIDIAELASKILPERIECDKLILTHGSNGCITWEAGRGVVRIPAFTKTVVDTVGAGDAFFAVTAPLVAAGGRMDHVGFIGNAAGAIKVGIVGHRKSVDKIPLIKFLTALLK